MEERKTAFHRLICLYFNHILEKLRKLISELYKSLSKFKTAFQKTVFLDKSLTLSLLT